MYTRLYAHVCTHVYTYVYTYVCTHVYSHAYTHASDGVILVVRAWANTGHGAAPAFMAVCVVWLCVRACVRARARAHT